MEKKPIHAEDWQMQAERAFKLIRRAMPVTRSAIYGVNPGGWNASLALLARDMQRLEPLRKYVLGICDGCEGGARDTVEPLPAGSQGVRILEDRLSEIEKRFGVDLCVEADSWLSTYPVVEEEVGYFGEFRMVLLCVMAEISLASREGSRSWPDDRHRPDIARYIFNRAVRVETLRFHGNFGAYREEHEMDGTVVEYRLGFASGMSSIVHRSAYRSRFGSEEPEWVRHFHPDRRTALLQLALESGFELPDRLPDFIGKDLRSSLPMAVSPGFLAYRALVYGYRRN